MGDNEVSQLVVKHEYDGSLTAIWNLLREVEKKLDTHIAENEKIQPKLMEVIDVLTTSKGILSIIKWVASISVGLLALHTFFGKYLGK